MDIGSPRKKVWYCGRTVEREPKTCLVFCIQLENGKRYSVYTDMVVCTMAIPISLSRLKNFKKYILFFNLIRTQVCLKQGAHAACGFDLDKKIYFFIFFNPLRLIGIDIVQTMMSVSTLYLFPFSSYLQNQTCFRCALKCSFGKPKVFFAALNSQKNTSTKFHRNMGIDSPFPRVFFQFFSFNFHQS